VKNGIASGVQVFEWEIGESPEGNVTVVFQFDLLGAVGDFSQA
jgi:hypothetical protein